MSEAPKDAGSEYLEMRMCKPRVVVVVHGVDVDTYRKKMEAGHQLSGGNADFHPVPVHMYTPRG